MSTTADASVTITCPDWCDFDAALHASELFDQDGQCVHNGLLAAVEDPTGRGPEWTPWRPEKTISSDLIPVGVTITTAPDGHPLATPGIRLGHDLYAIEQIEALIPWLHEAIRLARAELPDTGQATS